MNILSETYTSTEIVIMCNLRLPEFDKIRNVDKKRLLYFSKRLVNMMPFWVLISLDKNRLICKVQHRNHVCLCVDLSSGGRGRFEY